MTGDRATPGRRARPWRFVVLAVILLGAAALAVVLVLGRGGAAPSVPAPAELAAAEAQIRTYIDDHRRWVAEAPDDQQRQATLGLVYAANGYWDAAKACFETFVRLDPDEPLGHLYVAVMDEARGDLDAPICRRVSSASAPRCSKPATWTARRSRSGP
jgi:cytochrome c-type biogenesis protein CcmH/NrfG